MNESSYISAPGDKILDVVGWADKIHGLTAPGDGPYQLQTLHEPIGVVGMILPWNFPLLLYTWKVAPALASVNTAVVKTAEQTPLSSLLISQLLHEHPKFEMRSFTCSFVLFQTSCSDFLYNTTLTRTRIRGPGEV